jgi:hypothetical protein
LPASFLTQFPQGAEIAFETIPVIPSLPQPLKDAVRDSFGVALKVVWQVLLGVSILGLLCTIGMKQLQLHTRIDEDWGRVDLPVDHNLSQSASRQMQQTTDMKET